VEAAGVPTVTVTSEAFVELGRREAAAFGMPDLPCVVVPHPVAHRPPEELRRLAADVYADVVRALTGPPSP
jgi:hypothetical protein